MVIECYSCGTSNSINFVFDEIEKYAKKLLKQDTNIWVDENNIEATIEDSIGKDLLNLIKEIKNRGA